VRLLFVTHTSRMSGAERSLLELIEVARGDAEVLLVSPPGELIERARARDIPTAELTLPAVGFRTNLLAAAYRLAAAGWSVRMLAHRHNADAVHAASARAGLLAASCILSGRRRVVDVRDLLPRSRKATAVRWTLRLTANLIVFNSHFTRDRFGATAPARSTVMYPPVDVEPLLGLPLRSRQTRGRAPVLGVLGQLTPWKGQDDAIRILALVRERVPEARLRIVGSVVFSGADVSYDNEVFRRRLPVLAEELGVADAVELAGETEDLPSTFRSLDVLLVPSWEEPFGRVVVEGMAAGVPVVATRAGGPAEIIEDGVSGFLALPRVPAAWVEPIVDLLESVELSRRVGKAGRERIATLLEGTSVRSVMGLHEAGARP
jgi:glycosyltransferase involved in cell wall biosynthesis